MENPPHFLNAKILIIHPISFSFYYYLFLQDMSLKHLKKQKQRKEKCCIRYGSFFFVFALLDFFFSQSFQISKPLFSSTRTPPNCINNIYNLLFPFSKSQSSISLKWVVVQEAGLNHSFLLKSSPQIIKFAILFSLKHLHKQNTDILILICVGY